jgi:hypothetical protein
MEQLIWFFSTAAGFEVIGLWLRPILLGIALYYSSYGFILVRTLLRDSSLKPDHWRLAQKDRQDALVVLPTLLRKKAELEGLKRAILSVVHNGYPGRLVVCPSIDDAGQAPQLCDQLERWAATLDLPRNVSVAVAFSPDRGGKAVAIEEGINLVKRMVHAGELASFPAVFFNMDADSELDQDSLERMVWRLTRKGRYSGECPLLIAANVHVRSDHYWRGWRYFFSLPGQLALQVAREYMTSISLARHNSRLLPVTSVSGALYCTWSQLYTQAPRYANFIHHLRWRDYLLWWLGAAPPSFANSHVAPLPEATTGPGDDTWIAWLALSARWRGEHVDLELPSSPLHALVQAFRSYIFRPIAYVPEARVFTATPTTLRGLFRQRIRWNSSRIWLINRFGLSLLYKWCAGLAVYLDVAILVALHGVIVVGLLLWPLTSQPAQWVALAIVANLGYMLIRGTATVLAIWQDRAVGRQWTKLLALPLSGLYHVTFNIVTTVVGLVQDLLLCGVNTGFAPESTLIKSGTGRVALWYRLRRALLLAIRAVTVGDVPLGWFWLGWEQTPWTPNGYQGWTDRDSQQPPVLPPASVAPVPAAQEAAAQVVPLESFRPGAPGSETALPRAS